MESSRSLPEPFESDKDKDKEDEKKPSRSFRAPLPADALHGSAPRKEVARSAEQVDGILPIFPKRERPAEVVKAEKPVIAGPAEHITEDVPTHPALESLKDELWKDFDAAPPVPFDTVGDRHAAAESTVDHQAEDEEDDKKSKKSIGPRVEFKSVRPELTIPAPDEWHESRTLHLNEPEPPAEHVVAEAPSEDEIAAAPSNAGMAAEVAATEPDNTIDMLEKVYAMPAAELPADHAEAEGKPLPPLTEQQRFQDIMSREDFSEDFVQAASVPPTPQMPQASLGGDYVPSSYVPSTEVTYSEPVPPTPVVDPYRYYGPPTRQAEQTPPPPAQYVQERPQAVYPPQQEQFQQPQPYAPAEQAAPAPITNEQRTTVSYPEQFRPATVATSAEVPRPQPTGMRPEQMAAVPTAPAEEAEELAQNSEHRTHTVESAWHRVEVENNTGRVVEGQPEGRAMAEEKRAENTPIAPTLTDDNAQDASVIADDTGMYQLPLPGGISARIGSGQIGMSHELGSGQADSQHRLEAPRNPVVTALTSPLLWVGVVVLLLAFFAAAFL